MLLLDEPSRSLTERFHGGQISQQSLGEHPVLARWARVARLGLAPDAPGYPEVASGADLVVRRDRLDDAFREENALLDQVAGELAGRDVVALLADPDGVILASRGGEEFQEGAARVRLVEGACWSETTRGTNAIGTAAAEAKAVAVVGRAHYELRIATSFVMRRLCGTRMARSSPSWTSGRWSGTIRRSRQPCSRPGTRSSARCVPKPSRARARGVSRCSSGSWRGVEAPLSSPRPRGAYGLPTMRRTRCSTAASSVACRRPARCRGAHPSRASGSSACRSTSSLRWHARGTGPRGSRSGGRPSQSSWIRSSGRTGARWRSWSISIRSRRGGARTVPSLPYMPCDCRRRGNPAFAPLRGTDPPFLQAIALAQRFAATPLPVLLLAETGTGKELFARAIHGASARGGGPFVALNCAAISESILESELFGHAPGAFTGAARTGSEGKIGAASGGTLFLDEIAEMPEAVQSALLRVLDDGTYYRVGDGRLRRSDFRLVGATCRDLAALVERGTFRRDLFYRIHGARVTIPPLRERSDRLSLARALLVELRSAAGQGAEESVLTEDASQWIERHAWPGNVRELKSALLHGLALAGDGPIAHEHFPEILVSNSGPASDGDRQAAPGARTKDEVLRDEYAATIRACAGNVTEAARRLGVARSTLYRTLKR